MIKVTAKDALRSSTVTPGWYIGKCIEHYTKAAGTDGSALDKFELEIVSALNGTPSPFDGVPLKTYQISGKAVGFGINFLVACGLPKEALEALKKGQESAIDIDPKECVNKTFKVFVSNTKFENRVNNEATDFLPLV